MLEGGLLLCLSLSGVTDSAPSHLTTVELPLCPAVDVG